MRHLCFVLYGAIFLNTKITFTIPESQTRSAVSWRRCVRERRKRREISISDESKLRMKRTCVEKSEEQE